MERNFNTGSRIPEGKARQIAANTKHGNETRAIHEERSAKLAELYKLEMLGRELGLISGVKVGRRVSKGHQDFISPFGKTRISPRHEREGAEKLS